MYNSISKFTEVSCIDHIYCNHKFKCSPPRVLVSGASDHDIISYVRYSKSPPVPARTIRRRSYRHFVQENFLTDLAEVDWGDVLTAVNLDAAVEMFTNNFNGFEIVG